MDKKFIYLKKTYQTKQTSVKGGIQKQTNFRLFLLTPFLFSLLLIWASNAQAQSCSNPDGTAAVNWQFNGDLIDSSGNGRDLVNAGAAAIYSTTATEGSNSIDLSNGPYLYSLDPLFYNGFSEKSVSMNIQTNTPATGSSQYLYEEKDERNGIAILLDGAGQLVLEILDVDVSDSCEVDYPTDGEFHQVGFIFEASFNKAWLYLDGYPVCAVESTGSIANHGVGVGIGRNIYIPSGSTISSLPFTGLIDDVSVFTGANNLTPKKMLDIADCALSENLLTDLVDAGCPAAAYLVQTNVSDWYGVDLVTGMTTPSADNLNYGINAQGYNELDGRIWGVISSTPPGKRSSIGFLSVTSPNLDGTFTTQMIGPVAGLDVIYNAGDVLNGVLYLTDNSTTPQLVTIDVDATSPTYLQILTNIPISEHGAADVAANPVDGKLYGISGTGNLMQIDPVTGNVVNLGSAGTTSSSGAWGGVYFDNIGNLYVSHNQTGEIDRVDLRTDPGTDYDETKTAFFAFGPQSGGNDGSRCPRSLPIDWGDAPEADQGTDSHGTAYGFCTSLDNNGPRHGSSNFDISASTGELTIGANMTVENDGQPDSAAALDDYDDGIASLTPITAFGSASPYTMTVAVSNTTGADATLCGWLDSDLSQTFTNNTPGCIIVPDGATSVDLPLNVSSQQVNINDEYFMRLRIASDPAELTSPCGSATSGEVEDYLIPAGILPVTLSSFDSSKSGKRLNIDWGTASELFNSGFQLWGLDKPSQQWQPLNKWLVASGNGNSVEPQSYTKMLRIPAAIKALESLGISSVDSNGQEHYYGPFEVGKRYGELTHLDPIDWSAVRAQADTAMAAKGYTRVFGKGYRKIDNQPNSTTAVQFSVSATGLYKLKAQDMLLSGSDWSEIPKGEIALLDSAGTPIARHIIAKGSGKGKARTLGDSGSIVFYANTVDQVQGLYSGEAVYRIVRDTTKARQSQVQGKQGLDGSYRTSYTEHVWIEQQNRYLVNNVLPDPWMSAVVLSYPDKMRGAIYSVPIETDVLRDQPMELIIRAVRSSALDVVDADSDGIQDPEHILQGVIASPSSATGYVLLEAQTAVGAGAWETRFPIPEDIELPTTGVINAGAAMTAGAGYRFSEIYVDAVGVSYSRPYVPKAGDSHLNFMALNQDDSGYRVQVPLIGSSVSVYASDGANLVKIRPERVEKARTASGERVKWISFAALQGADQYRATNPIGYWVTNNDGYLNVTNLHPISITAKAELLNAAQGSDYLIISHPAFMGDSLTEFANHKRSLGHSVHVVDYLELVNSFAGGQSGPQGLTDYLNAVESISGGSLANVLLVGGSTYDHRNYLGSDAITFIPSPYGQSVASRHTPSDSLYVQDANGAQFASIGRWPGRTAADIDTLISRTIQWDTQAIDAPGVLLIAEQTIAGEGLDFGLAMDSLSSNLPADYVQTKIYSTDELSASQAKPLIKAALNAAPQLVLYNGHGSTSQLSTRNLYNATDAADNQASRSALWLPMSCYMTYYESTSVNTLAHQLLFSGQSVAISGASLLSSQGGNLQMGGSILQGLSTDQSLGTSIDTAKAAANNPSTSVNWSLLGDPSIRLQ